MEFYTEQLEDSVGAKTNENQARTVLQNKQGIDLASQLYAISTIMEAYYAQNWNKSYLANIKADAKPLFALSQNRMIGALKTFSDKINKEIESKKKGLLKGDVSASEHKILELSDVLNAQPESPLLVLVKDALDKPSAPTELYLRPNGEVYQRSFDLLKRFSIHLPCNVGIHHGSNCINLLVRTTLQQLAVTVRVFQSNAVAHGKLHKSFIKE